MPLGRQICMFYATTHARSQPAQPQTSGRCRGRAAFVEQGMNEGWKSVRCVNSAPRQAAPAGMAWQLPCPAQPLSHARPPVQMQRTAICSCLYRWKFYPNTLLLKDLDFMLLNCLGGSTLVLIKGLLKDSLQGDWVFCSEIWLEMYTNKTCP